MSEHESKWQLRRERGSTRLMERRISHKSPDYFVDVAKFDNPSDAEHVLRVLRVAESLSSEH